MSPTQTSLHQSHHDLTALRAPSLHATLRRENVDLAYLLGAWTSMTEIGGQDWLAMSFTSQDPRQLTLLQERVASLFGEAPSFQPFSIHGIPYLRLNVPSVELAQHVREITLGNTRIPWEHLGTEAECVSFLQGLFDHGGWVYTGKSGGIGFNKKDGADLLADLCRVFARAGILPIVVDGDVPSLKLKDQAEWKGFADRIEISMPDRREAVQKLLSRTSTRAHYTAEDYSSVMAFANSPTLTNREIGEATGIPLNTARGWLLYGQKPPAVKREEMIKGIEKTLGSPEVVNAVYRILGASSPLARECGAPDNFARVRNILANLPEAIEDLYGDDELIASALLR